MNDKTTIDIPKPMLEWLKKDSFIIIVCLLTILIVMYMLLVSQSYKQACNEYWYDSIKSNSCHALCFDEVNNFSDDLNWFTIYEDQDKDKDT